jgi:hypothetical protein
MMKRTSIFFAAMVMAACSPAGNSSVPAAQAPAAGGTPEELKALVGARGSSGEMGLQQAGYEFRNGANTESSSITHWRGKTGACVEIATTDGRYASIVAVDAAKCADDSSAVAPSGKAGAMRTVCGVIVGGKTYRYLCEVEENRQGTTVLRMPDTTLRLTWNLGSVSVEVAQEGANPVVVKYAESEGETNFRVDERTFFYISNPKMADAEVKQFRK